jgi:DNA repair protein RecO (recombination protein O)
MPPQKTLGIVLTLLPFRESSCIMHLYTREHGLVQGIAKGIRRQGKEHLVIERGFLIETMAYIHANRNLHTLGSISVTEFFSGIRDDLSKTAIRDALCELCSATIHAGEQNHQLFEYLTSFLHELDSQPAQACFPWMLWRFYFHFSQLLGFGLNIETCLNCGKSLADTKGGILKSDLGGLICSGCEAPRPGHAFLPVSVLNYLNEKKPDAENPADALSSADMKKITRLLASYCRYHFEAKTEYRSLAFVDEMIDSMNKSRQHIKR